ncbi:hypothetical protein BYT27DRAFT_7091497 [Phlegmacium glaucopus]|nr:hypothetical protein BYT27DRAFT_7091497 [Phlegmacium glaucopus]
MSNLAILQDACIVAAYMKRKFPNVLVSTLGLQGPNVEIEHPPGWSVEFALEVDLALDVIARAFHNQVSTKWDVRRYADHCGVKYLGMTSDREDIMRNGFKPLKSDYLEIRPCTITDCHGWMLLWYLPNILRPERQESIFADLHMLDRALKSDPKQSNNWRTSPKYFESVEGGLKCGTLNISPAWFEQGHETNEHFLKVSLDLMKENPTCEWLRKSRSLFALMGGILSIVQPELFNLGVQALQVLESDPEMCDNPERLRELLGIWHMPFSALSVISNRLTPLHCDTGGRAEWMDLMLALGEYDNGRFGVPAFGYTFKYNPGTVVALSSKIFRHGATCEGNWAAISFYMRDNVLNRASLPTGTWLHRADYQKLLTP